MTTCRTLLCLLLALSTLTLGLAGDFPPLVTDPFFAPPSQPLSPFPFEPAAAMPVAQTVQSLPLSLSQLEQYALAASTDERLRLVSHHVDAHSDDWHYLQLLAWQTADMQTFQQRSATGELVNAPVPHCTSKSYITLLAAYKQNFPHSSQLRTIQLRHDLLTFLSSPPTQQQAVVDKISREYAHVTFDHTPHTADYNHGASTDEQNHDYPTRLDPALLQLDKLLSKPFEDGNNDLSAFSSCPLAADAIAHHLYSMVAVEQSGPTSTAQLRNSVARFLSQITHPAIPHLLDLVLYDLLTDTAPFGSRAAHGMLTLADLQRISTRLPDIVQQQQYVTARLERMLPDGGLEGLTVEQKTAFYDEQAEYVTSLSAAHTPTSKPTLSSTHSHSNYHKASTTTNSSNNTSHCLYPSPSFSPSSLPLPPGLISTTVAAATFHPCSSVTMSCWWSTCSISSLSLLSVVAWMRTTHWCSIACSDCAWIGSG